MQNILLSGCSLSDFSGWGQPGNKTDPRCWYNIVAQENNFNLTNVSYGGKSNREIIHAAAETLFCSDVKFDCVIIQLTGLNRYWYFDRLDAHKFVIVNSHKFTNQDRAVEQAFSLIAKKYSNVEREFEKDLVNLVGLHKIVKGLGANLILLNFLDFAWPLLNPPDITKPDEFNGHFNLCLKDKIIKLFDQLDYSYKLGFDKWLCAPPYVVDFADDGDHPGEKSNRIFANMVNELLSKIKND